MTLNNVALSLVTLLAYNIVFLLILIAIVALLSGTKRAAFAVMKRNFVGYFNNPIPRAWLRAPYLHNGSVPPIAQLIGLDPRPATFCRGANPYDPDALGLAAATGDCPKETPFLFDVSGKGDSNKGHYYPRWAFDGPRDDAKLRDLLAYLKGL